jgi:hypothetical protein
VPEAIAKLRVNREVGGENLQDDDAIQLVWRAM